MAAQSARVVIGMDPRDPGIVGTPDPLIVGRACELFTTTDGWSRSDAW